MSLAPGAILDAARRVERTPEVLGPHVLRAAGRSEASGGRWRRRTACIDREVSSDVVHLDRLAIAERGDALRLCRDGVSGIL